jgi:hypothetical protein
MNWMQRVYSYLIASSKHSVSHTLVASAITLQYEYLMSATFGSLAEDAVVRCEILSHILEPYFGQPVSFPLHQRDT